MVETEDAVPIPFYLMPIAAVLGSYAIFGVCRILYLVYANVTHKKEADGGGNGTLAQAPTSLLSRNFLTWLVTVIGAMIMYAKIVAQIEYAMALSEYAHFDPFEILGLEGSSTTSVNVTEVKAAYRRLAKEHHPDKSAGDSRLFQRIHTAYRALTTDKDAYDQYGHPDGPLSQQTLSFALPGWLLQPTGPVAAVLLVLYLAMFIGLIYVVITWLSPSTTHPSLSRSSTADANADISATTDSAADTAYLATTLGPDSTHMHVLWAIATTPETVALTQRMLDKIEIMRQESISKKQKKAAEDANKTFFAIQEEGWADDNEDLEDEATKRAKEEEARKEEQKQQLAEATGAAMAAPMEGVDEGVLGQLWVERTLERFGQWPPTKAIWPCLEDKIFIYRGKAVSALEHPAVKRNLCFTMGRLNSIVLNTHTELCKCLHLMHPAFLCLRFKLHPSCGRNFSNTSCSPDAVEASSKKLIDQTYFKSSLEYRQRAGLLLEASLRIAVTMHSYRLAKTIIETVSMFKIGVRDPLAPKTLDWFHSIMTKQYTAAGLPKLLISDLRVEPPPGEAEIATDDTSVITLTMERAHAEAFTRIKVAQCQAQGIPPQIALQTYREGWWLLIRVKKVSADGSSHGDTLYNEEIKEIPLLTLLTDAEKAKFASEKNENRLVVAWPMIVQNMAQKSGKVKVQFKVPSAPGRYVVCLAVKSQEFLGSDQEFELPIDVVDVATVTRVPKASDEDDAVDDESKKDQ